MMNRTILTALCTLMGLAAIPSAHAVATIEHDHGCAPACSPQAPFNIDGALPRCDEDGDCILGAGGTPSAPRGLLILVASDFERLVIVEPPAAPAHHARGVLVDCTGRPGHDVHAYGLSSADGVLAHDATDGLAIDCDGNLVGGTDGYYEFIFGGTLPMDPGSDPSCPPPAEQAYLRRDGGGGGGSLALGRVGLGLRQDVPPGSAAGYDPATLQPTSVPACGTFDDAARSPQVSAGKHALLTTGNGRQVLKFAESTATGRNPFVTLTPNGAHDASQNRAYGILI